MGRTLLVIDDESGFAEMVLEYFRQSDYKVHAALNLEDAIMLFKQFKPDVVILDYNMPMVTGEKFLPILHSLNPTVKVILITGELEEEVKDKFKGMSYFAFFEKGNFSLEQLKAKVEEALL